MLVIQDQFELILESVASLLDQARSLPMEGLLSVTFPVSRTRPPLPPTSCRSWFYWARPQESHYRLGLGQAFRLQANGASRIAALDEQLNAFSRNWFEFDPRGCGVRPVAFAGFAFSAVDRMTDCWAGYPNSALFFPELLYQQLGERCAITFTCRSASLKNRSSVLSRWERRIRALKEAFHQSPPPASASGSPLKRTDARPKDCDWIGMANQAAKAIAGGRFRKVVPAQRIDLEAGHELMPTRLLDVLRDWYPSCTLFGIDLGGATLVAATPEQLVRCSGNHFSIDALAGTIPRSGDADRDRVFASHLMSDQRLRREHDEVIKSILQAIGPHCSDIHYASPPEIVRLRGMQHLHTPLSGLNTAGCSALRLASCLHPSAAVGGSPRTAAGRWLDEHEPISRGWYSGGAGIVEPGGDGDLSVLLRCALIKQRRAVLYAGAGMVEGSDPQRELQEIELKFGTMLEALSSI
jgi:menaquinone-specific isochorismate synthase